MKLFLVVFCLIFTLSKYHCSGLLYPHESETRQVKQLDGIWNFRIIPRGVDQNIGFKNKWFENRLELSGDVIPMPVPSSYNDITQSRDIRDYVGWAWYDQSFFAPQTWKNTNQKVILRFGSVHYMAMVYLNGLNVVNHTGGHLPFEADVTDVIKYGIENLITVAVNNTLSDKTIPTGSVQYKTDTNNYPEFFYETTTNFDFFNYAGIHRSVQLYVIPKLHIDDITINTRIESPSTGMIDYSIVHKGDELLDGQDIQYKVSVFDKKNKLIKIETVKGSSGTMTLNNATFWWPFTMHEDPGYQYVLKFELFSQGTLIDTYHLKIGIRTVKVDGTRFLINGKDFYFRGFGKHEDANIRGKGLDLPMIVKDFNLIKWIGANSFRTSHYPYSEELMDQADAQGIVVIDECPAVGLIKFNDILLKQHLNTITELIARDKNRPSVVMWSIANEPTSKLKEAKEYFKKVSQHARSLDSTRPITAAINMNYDNDLMSQSLDVLMINRYYGWYSDTGYPQVIQKKLITNFDNWHKTFNDKPIMMSEYGADTVAGLHMDPSFVFSEDYQTEYLMEHHKAFDKLRSANYFVGELIWNFADFMTTEQTTRVMGNKKGIFTRERQPKASARVLRCRYWHLAGQLKYESTKDNNFYCPA